MELPELGSYVSGVIFMHSNHEEREYCEKSFQESAQELGLEIFHWRDVPRNSSCLGSVASKTEPAMRQVFMKLATPEAAPGKVATGHQSLLARKAFILRKWAQKR